MTVADIESWLGRPLPDPYRSFLASANDDFLAANSQTLLYAPQNVIERNETYEVQTYCPGNLAIGDDSGGSAMILSLEDGSIHRVDHGAMTPDCFQEIAPNFAAWAQAGYPVEG